MGGRAEGPSCLVMMVRFSFKEKRLNSNFLRKFIALISNMIYGVRITIVRKCSFAARFLARTHDGQFGHTWIDEQITQALHFMANPIMVIEKSTGSRWSPEEVLWLCQ